jgi:hypothetical protein
MNVIPTVSFPHASAGCAAWKRSWRFWLFGVTAPVAVLCCVCVTYVGIEILQLASNDARALRMARILAHLIRSCVSAFKNVVENVSNWRNGHDMPATAYERLWNRH